MTKKPLFDEARMGANLYRSTLSIADGYLTLTHRTWLYALTFAGLAALPVIVIVRSGVRFAGSGILLYLGAALLALAALLYALYRERVSFQFATRRCTIQKSFVGARRTIEIPFGDIKAVTVRKALVGGGPTPGRTRSRPPMIVWSIGLATRNVGPTFEFWQSSDPESTRYIASVLAASLGCGIKETGIIGDTTLIS